MIPRLLKQRRGEQEGLPVPLEDLAANEAAPQPGLPGPGAREANSLHWAERRRSKPVLRPRHNSLKSICNTMAFITVVWLVTLVCAEYLSFHLMISACAWPDEAWERSGEENASGTLLVQRGAPQLQEFLGQVLGDVGLDQAFDVAVDRSAADQGAEEAIEESRKRRTVRVAVIGDPQLTDKRCYWFLDDRDPMIAIISPILTPIVEFFSDIFMRKSFQLLQMYHEPEAVFFLGDLFDSAKYLSGREYEAHMKRFRWIFEPASISPEGKRYPMSSKHYEEFVIPFYNLTGNHDIGYDIPPAHQARLVDRYVKHFGPLNYEVIIGGVSFVGISAPTLEEGKSDPRAYHETMRFLDSAKDPNLPTPAKAMKEFSSQELATRWPVSTRMTTSPEHPRVLLHHVPLWRPEDADCGPERMRNHALSHRTGFSYVNVLSEKLSSGLIALFRPIISLSGDDHDQCKMRHKDLFYEHTVGTFSWLQGNPYPSYALLSVDPGLWPDNGEGEAIEKPRAELRVCYLPRQLTIFSAYFFLLLLSLVILVIDPLNPRRQRRSLMSRSLKFVDLTGKIRILLSRILYSVRRNSTPALLLLLFYFYLLWLAS